VKGLGENAEEFQFFLPKIGDLSQCQLPGPFLLVSLPFCKTVYVLQSKLQPPDGQSLLSSSSP
jgi:hypothetical protein